MNEKENKRESGVLEGVRRVRVTCCHYLSSVCMLLFLCPLVQVSAQETAASMKAREIEADETVKSAGGAGDLKGKPRLVVGGYGEVVMQRMFYSENILRYSYPDSYRDAKSYGRFDLPHVVFFISYDFGRGWKMSTEIEFEHGGTGSTYEIENSETGEYETELEKGGEEF